MSINSFFAFYTNLEYRPIQLRKEPKSLNYKRCETLVFNRVSETAFYSATRKNVLHDESDFSMMGDVPTEIASRNDIKVKIPGVVGFGFSMEVLFTSVPQYVERVFEHVSNEVVIPPFNEYKGTCRVHGYKQSKEFSATFKEVHSGEIVHVKGEWHGTKYLNKEILEVYSSLK